jgi:hypothetical protein
MSTMAVLSVQYLEEDFEQYITTDQVYKTPATPKTVIMRSTPRRSFHLRR